MPRSPSFLLLALLLSGCASSAVAPPPPLSIRTGDRVAAVLPYVRAAASKHGLAPDLILGVIKVESSFRPRTRSRVGARGLMQLMPRTAASLARRLGYDSYEIHDPAFNVDAGTAYIKAMLDRFEDRLELALAAYNSGPGRVSGWLKAGRPMPGYSKRYVSAVLKARAQMRAYLKGETFADPQDRAGLRVLIRDKSKLYGERPDGEL